MDLADLLWLQIAIAFGALILYRFISCGKSTGGRDWNFSAKKLWARGKCKEWKSQSQHRLREIVERDTFESDDIDSFDSQTIWATDMNSCSLYIKFNRRVNRTAEVAIVLRLPNGDEYHSPDLPGTMVFDSVQNAWSAGNLKLVLLEPFMKWRVLFNGTMIKKSDETQKGNSHHVRMNFIWIAASDPLRIPNDCSVDSLAEAVAWEPWKDSDWMDGIISYPLKGFDQCANLIGFVNIDDEPESQYFSLVGFKRRRWGPNYNTFMRSFTTVSGVLEDGVVYDFSIESNVIGLSRFATGYIRYPNSKVVPIDGIDVDLIKFINVNASKKVLFQVKADRKIIKIEIDRTNSSDVLLRGGLPWNWESKVVAFATSIDRFKGAAMAEFWSHYTDDFVQDTMPNDEHLEFLDIKEIDTEAICVQFSNREAMCAQFVGAKAASLALLSSVETHKYKVPNGFCLTTKALELQLNANDGVLDALEDIKKVNLKYSEIDLKDCCEKVQTMIINSSLHPRIKEEIDSKFEQLLSTKKNHKEEIFYAVRSSGIGEDSEECSAAGQNATILGCTSLADIYKAVLKCWSSLFTFQSVEYRRQHGQTVDCGMGVVIQEMVDARSAGVMFSRHPTTGDPSCILITSNFGLGETVVSGQVEPDHIYVNRDLENQLSIKNITVGKKTHKISLDKSNNTKTEVVIESNQLSVTDNECLSLASVAVMLEQLWGSPRDIEWAISQGELYLVQARPITSLQNWSEHELLHEMDSPTMTDQELVTFANTGEVIPNVMSPLGQSAYVRLLNRALNEGNLFTLNTKYFLNSLAATHHRLCLNVNNLMLIAVEEKLTVSNKIIDLSVYGRVVTDENMRSVAEHRNGVISFWSRMQHLVFFFKRSWNNSVIAKRTEEFSKEFEIDLRQCITPLDMYKKIERQFDALLKINKYHNYTTGASSFCQIIIFSIILEGKDDLIPENYQDIGTILSSASNVVSAEVPQKLAELAKRILDSGMCSEFLKIDPIDGVQWLKENCPDFMEEFESFLEKHGHRAIFEFDFMTDTWGLKPDGLIKALQTTLLMPLKDHKESYTNDVLLKKLVSPLRSISRQILKFCIPMCQRSVACRETTKSALVLVIHKFRMAYRQLAQEMAKEWMIPDKKLIFFLTHYELGQYLRTRDPKYVNKALLRQRYFPKWNKYKFDELIWGVPKPIDSNHKIDLGSETGVRVSGTPVYSGCVTGRACVVHDLSEIDELQNGDILITHATDIGWSPYFPLLGGVVTELGGLISHGAVVAREYGLPCIVGAQKATSVFKTGDRILLNAQRGYIQKLDDEGET